MAGFGTELISIGWFNRGEDNYAIALRCAVAWLWGAQSSQPFGWSPDGSGTLRAPRIPPGVPSSPDFNPNQSPAVPTGVIFFPAGEYLIDVVTGMASYPNGEASYHSVQGLYYNFLYPNYGATVVVPSGITLLFAPGASLRLADGVVLAVAGEIPATRMKLSQPMVEGPHGEEA